MYTDTETHKRLLRHGHTLGYSLFWEGYLKCQTQVTIQIKNNANDSRPINSLAEAENPYFGFHSGSHLLYA